MPTLDEENRTPISEISEPVKEEKEERESLEIPQVDSERTEVEETPSEVEETPQESEQEESSSNEDEEQAPVLLGATRSGSDDRIPISEMSELIQMNNDDLVVTVQTVNGVKTTFKAPLTLLGSHLLKVMQFASDLETTTKTIIGAINELAGGTGGASSLGELTDVTITSPSTGQVLTYDATTNKWVNGAGAEIALTSELISTLVTLADGADDFPLKKWKTTITPIQASGTPSPTNPLPISGRTQIVATHTGKNLLGGSKLLANAQAYLTGGTTDTTNKTFAFASTASTTDGLSFTSGIKFKERTRYTFIMTASKSSGNGFNMRIYYTDGTNTNISGTGTAKNTVVVTSSNNKTVDKVTKYNSSGTTTLYYEECGVFEGVVSLADFEAYAGESKTISLGTTVVGGELDILTGQGKKTIGLIEYDETSGWTENTTGIYYISVSALGITTDIISCNIFEKIARGYSSALGNLQCNLNTNGTAINFKNEAITSLADWLTFVAANHIQIEYPLATEETFTATGEDFSTSDGDNGFYTDCGESDIVYVTKSTEQVVEIVNDVVDSKVKVLTGTLTAGNTTITFTDNALTSNCTKTLYVDDAFFGVAPTAMVTDYANHSVTYTFPVQASNMPVKLEVK